jgi:two-component system, cell cycle response regulator
VQVFSALGWRIWDAIAGPSGWRSVVGPFLFVFLGVGLLVYDHLNDRVTDVVFWLTLGLIVTVFGRMLETNRRQSRALAERRLADLSDRVTALPNRRRLEADVRAVAAPGESRVLVLLQLEGLQRVRDREGDRAGDELLRGSAEAPLATVVPMGGGVYRVGTDRFAALAPQAEGRLGEALLAATDSVRTRDPEGAISRSYGEVAIPGEARDLESALQIAGQRLSAYRQRQQRSARRQAHAVLVAALSARRPELRDHLRAVAYRAISLARRLDVDTDEIDDIALAAELQDVGLLSVPEAVLEKPGALNEVEKAMVDSHTVEGARIISAAPGLASVARLVRSSSERFDGHGFPDGLAGEAIPLGARVIAVAVAFAALTAQRPFRPALNTTEALAELQRCAGTQFDPRVVAALGQDLIEEGASRLAVSAAQGA